MRSTGRSLFGVALCAVLAWGAAPARAQHGTAGYGVIPMPPHDSALLEVQTAGFDLPGRAGVWQVVAPRLEYAVVPWFSVAARPTLVRIDYDDGRSELGPGDAELAVKALVWHADRRRTTLSLGLSGELPTGDPERGTGNGHVSLFPFATLMAMPERWLMVHAMAGDRVVVGGADHGAHAAGDPHAGHGAHAHHVPGVVLVPHGSVVMPHSDHELAVHGGACFILGTLWISPSLELMQVLSPGDDTFLTAQFELALRPRRELRIAAGFDLPLLDDPRFDWRSRLMAALLW